MGYYHRAGVSGYLHGGCQRHRRPCFVDDEAFTTTTCRQWGAKQERAAKTKTEKAGRNGAGWILDRRRTEEERGHGSAMAHQDDAAAGGALWALPPLPRLQQAEAEQGEVTIDE